MIEYNKINIFYIILIAISVHDRIVVRGGKVWKKEIIYLYVSLLLY